MRNLLNGADISTSVTKYNNQFSSRLFISNFFFFSLFTLLKILCHTDACYNEIATMWKKEISTNKNTFTWTIRTNKFCHHNNDKKGKTLSPMKTYRIDKIILNVCVVYKNSRVYVFFSSSSFPFSRCRCYMYIASLLSVCELLSNRESVILYLSLKLICDSWAYFFFFFLQSRVFKTNIKYL